MSMSVKQTRGQLRQIVKEMMPELLATELYTKLQAAQLEALETITKNVSETLKIMQQRQLDMQSYIMREVSAGQIAQPKTTETKNEG